MKKLSRKTPVNEALKLGKHDCSNCVHCCSFGSGYVLNEEVARLARDMKITEKELKEKYLDEIKAYDTDVYRFKQIKKKNMPHGRCILLTRQGCPIHDIKPLHCKITNCGPEGEHLSIWFALKYLVDPNNHESVRQWRDHLKTHPTIEGGKLEDIVPDKQKLKEILN